MLCRRYLVSGRVQGVFFRASTREVALAEGLVGWARNLNDGRVEVVAKGPQEQLDRFGRWLREGPPLAQVDEVLEKDLDPGRVPADSGFATR